LFVTSGTDAARRPQALYSCAIRRHTLWLVLDRFLSLTKDEVEALPPVAVQRWPRPLEYRSRRR
jgi:hypothetical protein